MARTKVVWIVNFIFKSEFQNSDSMKKGIVWKNVIFVKKFIQNCEWIHNGNCMNFVGYLNFLKCELCENVNFVENSFKNVNSFKMSIEWILLEILIFWNVNCVKMSKMWILRKNKNFVIFSTFLENPRPYFPALLPRPAQIPASEFAKLVKDVQNEDGLFLSVWLWYSPF